MVAPKLGNKKGATFTLINNKDQTHVTFRTRREETKWTSPDGKVKRTYTNIFVDVMDGTDNTKHFRTIGTLSEKGFFKAYNIKFGRKGMASKEEVITRQNIFTWFNKRRWQATEAKHKVAFPSTFIFKTSGRCARCNRKLTNPDSLAIFLGPECAKH